MFILINRNGDKNKTITKSMTKKMNIYKINPLTKFACAGCETFVHRANLYECKECDEKLFMCFNCLGEHKKEQHNHKCQNDATPNLVRSRRKKPLLSK
jgi:hypothetical protein